MLLFLKYFIVYTLVYERCKCVDVDIKATTITSLKKEQSKNLPLGQSNNEESDFSEEAKMFDNIKEIQDTKVSNARSISTISAKDDTLGELKTILLKMLCKLDNIGAEGCKDHLERKAATTGNPFLAIKEISERVAVLSTQTEKGEPANGPRRPRWGQWTAWSSCSVTCGKGREIRWRHCLLECDAAETEMEEKTCQLPACAPKHIFGIK